MTSLLGGWENNKEFVWLRLVSTFSLGSTHPQAESSYSSGVPPLHPPYSKLCSSGTTWGHMGELCLDFWLAYIGGE